VFWPCRDGYINFIFYGGVAGRRTNEQLVAWMRECGADLGALAAIDWKVWDPTKADQTEVDAIEAPVAKFFACLSKREFLSEGHRREMLGYPVSTVADIASDPQLAARGFFQTVAGSAERFCGSFAVIDGARPPLRHAPGAPFAAVKSTQAEPAMAEPPRRAGSRPCPRGRGRWPASRSANSAVMPRAPTSARCWPISAPAPFIWNRASAPTASAFNIRRSRTTATVTTAAAASPSSTIRSTASPSISRSPRGWRSRAA